MNSEHSIDVDELIESNFNLRCCGNCKLFCDKKCPHKEQIDGEQIEYYPPDYGCASWIYDGKTTLQRNIR
jgi:hypothetical protein